MNLTADEYLTIIDEMTLLRIQNQRFIEDNSILAQRVEEQNILLLKKKQQSRASHIDQTTNYYQTCQPEISHLNYDTLKPFSLPFDNQIRKSQSMKALHQKELLQRQIQCLRNQINSMKSLKKTKCSLKIDPSFKKIDKKIKKTTDPSKSKQIKQLYENSKLLYSLENKFQKDPSIDQISSWICGKELQRKETQMNVDQDEFNPIKIVKQAQRQKILQELTNKTFNIPTKKESIKICSSQSKALKPQQQLKSDKSIKGKQSIKIGSSNKINTNQTNNNQNLRIMKKSKSDSKTLTQTGQRNEFKREGSSSKINSCNKKVKTQN